MQICTLRSLSTPNRPAFIPGEFHKSPDSTVSQCPGGMNKRGTLSAERLSPGHRRPDFLLSPNSCVADVIGRLCGGTRLPFRTCLVNISAFPNKRLMLFGKQPSAETNTGLQKAGRSENTCCTSKNFKHGDFKTDGHGRLSAQHPAGDSGAQAKPQPDTWRQCPVNQPTRTCKPVVHNRCLHGPCLLAWGLGMREQGFPC